MNPAELFKLNTNWIKVRRCQNLPPDTQDESLKTYKSA